MTGDPRVPADDAQPALRCEGLRKSYAGVEVLSGVSFALGAGRVLGLVGQNGAGKSTLMNVLGGVVAPDAGHMWLSGAPHAPAAPADATRAGLAFIHQELNLFLDLSVAENLLLDALPRRLGLLDRGAMRRRARTLLDLVGLAVDPDAPMAALSPGERQLCEIARCLGREARVVILDEPTTSLTPPEIERLFTLVRRLRAEGRSFIFISHALGDVLELCDDVLVLRDGATVAAGPRADFDVEKLIAAMIGRSLDRLFPVRAGGAGDAVAIEARALRVPGRLDGVSFSLRRGEILGIAGLMGAGRTTLLRALFGLDPVSTGNVALGGAPFAPAPRAALAAGMAIVTESRRDDGLLLDASVRENVALASLQDRRRGPLLDLAGLAKATAAACAEVALPPAKLHTAAVRTLSGGNQQKVILARWLMRRPSVLLLDEPTRGVDVGAKQEIYALIAALADAGTAVLLASSELDELMGLCDRTLILCRGRLTGDLPRARFDRAEILRRAFGEGASS